jgi:hypothetical protein
MTLEHWRQDLRLARRGLRRAKGFTATAVLTLAMGIAGASVMFALIEGVLLRPLPVHETCRSPRAPQSRLSIRAVAREPRIGRFAPSLSGRQMIRRSGGSQE